MKKREIYLYYDENKPSKEITSHVAKYINVIKKVIVVRQTKITTTVDRNGLAKNNITKLPAVIYNNHLYQGPSSFAFIESIITKAIGTHSEDPEEKLRQENLMIINMEDEEEEESDKKLSAAETTRRMQRFQQQREQRFAQSARNNKGKPFTQKEFKNDDEFFKAAGREEDDNIPDIFANENGDAILEEDRLEQFRESGGKKVDKMFKNKKYARGR